MMNNYSITMEETNQIKSYMVGVESALNDATHLVTLKKQLVNLDRRYLSQECLQLLNISIASCERSIGVSIPKLSLESNQEGLVVSLETLSSSIKTIWKNILATLTHMWDKVVEFFKKIYAEVNQRIGKYKTRSDNLKQLERKLAELKLQEELPMIDNESLLTPLKYLNKELTENDIIHNLDELGHSANKVRATIKTIEQSYNNVGTFMDTVYPEDTLSNLYSRFSEYNVTNGFLLTHEVDDIMRSIRTNNVNDDDIDIIVSAYYDIDRKDIVHSSVVKLDGFIDGARLYFFLLESNREIGYQAVAVDRITDSDDEVSLRCLSVYSLSICNDKLTGLIKFIGDIMNDGNKAYDRTIKLKHREIIGKLNKLVANSDSTDHMDEIVKGFDIIKSTTKSLIRLVVETQKTYTFMVNTATYYGNLIEACSSIHNSILQKNKS